MVSLYFGISGYLVVDLIALHDKAIESKIDTVKVGDTAYPNKYYLLYADDKVTIQNKFPYLKDTTESLALIITALAFGAIGGLTRILNQFTFENKPLDQIKVNSLILLGSLSGIFILGITYVIPTILVSGDQKIRPETLIFLSLFSGLFSEKFYSWLSQNFNTFFKQNEK